MRCTRKVLRHASGMVVWGVTISGCTAIRTAAQDYAITRTASSPYASTITATPEQACNLKQLQALTGRLLFITRMWRPDIRYTVQRMCTKTKAPTQQDLANGFRILTYLLGTKDEGIQLGPTRKEPVDIFIDAGEESLKDRATSGILIRIGNSPILWASRKQDVTTLSSTEAE